MRNEIAQWICGVMFILLLLCSVALFEGNAFVEAFICLIPMAFFGWLGSYLFQKNGGK